MHYQSIREIPSTVKNLIQSVVVWDSFGSFSEVSTRMATSVFSHNDSPVNVTRTSLDGTGSKAAHEWVLRSLPQLWAWNLTSQVLNLEAITEDTYSGGYRSFCWPDTSARPLLPAALGAGAPFFLP